jgi:hypothetical protein
VAGAAELVAAVAAGVQQHRRLLAGQQREADAQQGRVALIAPAVDAPGEPPSASTPNSTGTLLSAP